MNKKGTEQMIAVYWFVILLLVTGAIAYMVFLFYGKPYSVNKVEAEILTNKIANCLAEGGYLKSGVVDGLNDENILERCDLNFNVEDFENWKDEGQYYFEVEVYNFDEDLSEGEVGTSFIPKIVYGNEKLVEGRVSLQSLLAESINIDVYQPGFGKGYTYENSRLKTACNLWARDFLDMRSKNVNVAAGVKMGGLIDFKDYNISCLNPGKTIETVIVSTTISAAFENAIKAAEEGIIKEVTAEEAQELANRGIVVWITCTDPGHEAIVYPDFNKVYDEEKGPKIAQTGGKPGVMYISNSYAWGSNWKDYDIRFYVFPKYDETVEQELSGEESISKVLDVSEGRNFYAVDRDNNQYMIKILALVGKEEKNE